MESLCRDCFALLSADSSGPCPSCGGARVIRHAELTSLSIAHIDCDAFYATVEQRDDPTLAGKPVLVGGAKRGVVMAASYEARKFGIRSATPMFKALRACPDAVVVRPNMKKYSEVGREVRAFMQEVTPVVEPISIDEAFLDLGGTEKLHRASPAETLARLSARIESEIGINVSIGLSFNKFLAKIASARDKPRGFAIIGRAEALDFLAGQPVTVIWGVGAAMARRLAADGITMIGDLQAIDEESLIARYGSLGQRLARLSRGQDTRRVLRGTGRKSLSAETTFREDLSSLDDLSKKLWRLCEKVSKRLKAEEIGARTITLKLKSSNFKIRTRSVTLPDATQLADVIYRAGLRLLEPEVGATRWRLIGIGTSQYVPAADADPADLADPSSLRRRDAERAIDAIRDRFGDEAIGHGRKLAANRQLADGRSGGD